MVDNYFSLPMLFSIGFSGAFLSAMVGIGGGVIITSALMSLGIPSMLAVTTQLSNSVGTNFTGFLNYQSERDVDISLAYYLFIGSAIGSILEKYLVSFLQHLAKGYAIIKIIVLIMVIISGIYLLYDVHKKQTPVKIQSGASMQTWMIFFPFHKIFLRARIEMSILVPILVGCLTGMLTMSLGGSNSILIAPILTYLLGRSSPAVTGTALLAGLGINILVTLITTHGGVPIDFILLFVLVISGSLGASIGVRLSYKFNTKWLASIGAIVLLGIAAKMYIELDALDFRSNLNSKYFYENYNQIFMKVQCQSSKNWMLPILKLAYNEPKIYTYLLLIIVMIFSYVMQKSSSWLCRKFWPQH